MINRNDSRNDLPPVLWVGGGSGAGKTSVSRAVAMAADLAWYRVDAHAYEHRDRLIAAGVREPETRTLDERWSVPATELVDEFLSASVEILPLIMEDLAAMNSGVAVIVEGPQLLPELVAPHLTDRGHALWLVPTPEFRRSALAERPRLTRDRRAGLERLLERNALLDDMIRTQANALDLTVVTVDGRRDLSAMVDSIRDYFAPAVRSLPRFRSGEHRRRVRKIENDAMVGNIRSFLADMGSQAPPPRPHLFCCECEQLGCASLVECTLDAYDALRDADMPVIQHGHGKTNAPHTT